VSHDGRPARVSVASLREIPAGRALPGHDRDMQLDHRQRSYEPRSHPAPSRKASRKDFDPSQNAPAPDTLCRGRILRRQAPPPMNEASRSCPAPVDRPKPRRKPVATKGSHELGVDLRISFEMIGNVGAVLDFVQEMPERRRTEAVKIFNKLATSRGLPLRDDVFCGIPGTVDPLTKRQTAGPVRVAQTRPGFV
jgi:hypothetical protein